MTPEYVVLHCSATPPRMENIGAAAIDEWHKQRGWKGIGYHWVVKRDGRIEPGRAENETGAHCKEAGMNRRSIGICYVGGVDNELGEPEDNRTEDQKISTFALLKGILERWEIKGIVGHCDVPGVRKACPSFDVAKWLREAGLEKYIVNPEELK